MQVWPVGPTGHTDGPNDITLAHGLALLDLDIAHVNVDRVQAEAVIDHDGFAGEDHAIMSQTDNSISRRANNRACWGRYIQPRMRGTRLTVQDTLAAKYS